MADKKPAERTGLKGKGVDETRMAEIPPRIPTDFYGSSKKVKRYMGDPFKIEIMVLWGRLNVGYTNLLSCK